MATSGSRSGELAVIDRFPGGVGWIADPDEKLARASHVVESDDGSWIVDPVDAEGVDELLEEYADPVGVVVLLDRHVRDSAAIATRHDVPVYVPGWMDGVAEKVDAPTERFGDRLAGFEATRLFDNPLWQEATLFDGKTLVVPEALGTVELFCASREELGVHPVVRLFPPRRLREYDPQRLLVGHGEGIFENVGPAIRRAIEDSRRNALELYAKNARWFLNSR